MNNYTRKKLVSVRKNISAVFWALLINTQLHAATEFDITVPERNSGTSNLAIYQINTSIYVDGTGPITFEVTDPEGVTEEFNLDPSMPCGAGSQCIFDYPATGTGEDSVSWVLPSTVGPLTDPARFKYDLTIVAGSNTDFVSGECSDSLPGVSETFTVQVTAGPQITSACSNSFELNNPVCGNIGGPIASGPVATINAGSSTDQLCQEQRPGVDAALVLDKSGSMNGTPMAGPSSTKIEALRNAVDLFIERWTDIRSAEPSSPVDQLGVVLFDAEASWLGTATGLAGFDTISPSIPGDLDLIAAGGATSIGDGLSTASAALAAGANRKVVLLMSDGKENTHQRVRLWDTNGGGSVLAWTDLNTIPIDQFESRIRIQLGSDSTAWADLSNEDLLRIYAVTIGSASAVSAEINQGLALATGGFYINSETNADILPIFFVELLQNFVKFNTWDVVALRAAETGANPYELSVPLTSTSSQLSVDLSWNPEFGPLCLDIFWPHVSDPITTCNSSDNGLSAGRLSWSTRVSASEREGGNTEDWRFVVRSAEGEQRGSIPFFMIAMADENNLKTDFSIGKGDYVPGSRIPIQVRMTESGRAVTSGVNVSALVAAPGQSVGDLLSASSANTSQPNDDDQLTNADAKLQNELSKNPDALQSTVTNLTLLDNGDSSNGDAVAGDGIYTALYQANAPGHYNFLFNSQGTSTRSGDLHKEQLVSIYVRNQPDPDETNITTSVTPAAGDSPSALNANFTPKTINGFKMGPGWANYFWFTANGVAPFKPIDNLDGSYTAKTNFSGDLPTGLALHFLDAAQFIEDSTTYDTLPLPLDSSTTVIPEIEVDDTTEPPKPWFLYLILLLLLLLIIYLLIKRSSSV